ncbi:F0F1 ATP synthase subunit B family protein [Sphingomicrobium lutaoense]|uniref:ATP synthase subunit b n=1 Tax=Sphingomicrobium lutaoense TaxID=515949 RepID=A0A839YY27_9SPHN|nr:ATPase [Sphingomicrobium lutaoense]MBB3764069.1 F-type H+-transporting ATPase subunit b [Sphingomicrobium lutaoense]
MPQIAQIGEIYASQLFWLAIFFGLSVIVIGYGMLPKVLSTVEMRDSQIAADLKEAEAAQARADALEDGYREAMDRSRAEASRLTAEAKATAAKKTEASLKRAETSINKKLDEAAEALAAARAAAMAEIEDVAAQAAADMVGKVTPLAVDEKAARQAVAKELNHG